VAGAQVIGKLAADAALAKGIKSSFLIAVAPVITGRRARQGRQTGVVLGKLATLAEAARAAGLKF